MGFILHVIRRAIILALGFAIMVIGASIILNSEGGHSGWPTLSEIKMFISPEKTAEVSGLQKLRARTLAAQKPAPGMEDFEMGEALGGGYNYTILDVLRMDEIFGGDQDAAQPMQIGGSLGSGQYARDSLSVYLHVMKGHLQRAMQGDKQAMIVMGGVAFSVLLSLFMILRFFKLMIRYPKKKRRIAGQGY